MRRRIFLKLGIGSIEASKAVAGDVCLYDKNKQELLIVTNTSLSAYPSTDYSPVGVVVVPGTHDVYGTGECAVMALKLMDCHNPNNGNVMAEVSIGNNYESNTEKRKVFSNRPNSVGYDENVYNYLTSGEGWNIATDRYNPSNGFADETDVINNPYDTDTWYYKTDEGYVASPYNENESRNQLYYQTSSPSSTSNCMSDFDGVGNTDIMTSNATYQSNWKTASTIEDSISTGCYPAACCCWRYHTEGTNQGDWYLPAIGELGYMFAKCHMINEVLSNLNVKYGIETLNITSYQYWSSTHGGGDGDGGGYLSWGITFARYLASTTQDNLRYCNAFLRVK